MGVTIGGQVNPIGDLKRKQRKRGMSQTQVISLSFFVIIIIGTLLLSLPISSRDREVTPLLDCLFTATSSTCVTGLVTVDTGTHWSLFGQCVILLMIQIGGLGFMTIATVLFMLINKKLGLRERELLSESINTLQIGGILKLAKRILAVTAVVELSGAALLSIRFCPEFGIPKGIFMGIFHSVSAFCNAGFDIMGFTGEYCSLTGYYNDVLVNVVIMLLIIIGGLGFLVWDDVLNHGIHLRKYRLHSKIVLSISAILVLVGAVVLFFSEADYSAAGMNFGERVLTSFFGSVTARTAGFNTVDTGALSPSGKLLTTVLMFIGGSPGSTAGGIKTTTFITLLLFGFSYIRKNSSFGLFGRRLESNILNKATAVFVTNLSLVILASLIICMADNQLPVIDVIFETTSAVATVGMSTGITRSLSVVSKLVIIFLMFCGRVGSLSFAGALAERKAPSRITAPAEDITIG